MMQMMRTTAAVSLAAVMTLGCSQQGAAAVFISSVYSI